MDIKSVKRAQFLINILYVSVIALLVYLALKYVVVWVFPFLLAFCIVTAVRPLTKRIVKLLGIKREIAAVIVMILTYAIAGTLFFLLILRLVFVFRDAFALLPSYYSSTIKPTVLSLGEWFSSFMQDLPESMHAQAESLQSDILSAIQTSLINLSQKGVSVLSGLTTGIPSFMIAFVFTIVLSFFIMMQYDKVINFFVTHLPARVTEVIRDTKIIFGETILKYVKASLTIMLVTATELSIGLLVLGQKNAIPVALGIAVFDALPFFGTGAIVIPWALISLINGNYTMALGLGLIYATVAFVRSVIEPKIVGDNLGLNPIVSLVSIYLGFKVFGVLGMILMPITTNIVLRLHRSGSIKRFRGGADNNPDSGT